MHRFCKNHTLDDEKVHKYSVFDTEKDVFNAKNVFLTGFLAGTNFTSEKWIFSAPAAVDWRWDQVFRRKKVHVTRPNLGAQSLHVSNDPTRKEETMTRKLDKASEKAREVEKSVKWARKNLQGQNSALGASF